MKPTMLARLENLSNRLTEINELLTLPEVIAQQDQFRKLNKEHAELSPVVALFNEYRQVSSDIETAQEMLADPEMKAFAQQEIDDGVERLQGIENELQILLLPKDPNDERNVFLEIRAGTGGDESALFAGDLLRMYTRYAEKNRWQVEMVSSSMIVTVRVPLSASLTAFTGNTVSADESINAAIKPVPIAFPLIIIPPS